MNGGDTVYKGYFLNKKLTTFDINKVQIVPVHQQMAV